MAECAVQATGGRSGIAVIAFENHRFTQSQVRVEVPAVRGVRHRGDIGHAFRKIRFHRAADDPVATIHGALVAQGEGDVLRWRADRAPHVVDPDTAGAARSRKCSIASCVLSR
jgi:hypothetical protein